MPQTQAEEAGAGLRIPHRAALAHQVGQEEQAVGARGQGGSLALDARHRSGRGQVLARRAEQALAAPDLGRTGRQRTAEGVDALQRAEHVREGDQPGRRQVVGADRAPAHAGAEHCHVPARSRAAGGQRGHGRIDPARDDRRTGRQAERRCLAGQQAADDLVRGHQPVGHQPARDAERIEHRLRPVACREVVDAADVAGRGVVDRHLAGQLGDDPGVRRQQLPAARPDLGRMLAQPQDLGVAVVAVDAVAGDALQLGQVEVLAHPAHLRLGAAVHPDQAGVQGGQRLVDRDAAAAVQAADADRTHVAVHQAMLAPAGLDHRADAGAHRVEPGLRILLRPKRARHVDRVAGAMLRQQAAVGRHQRGLGALRADVDADDEIGAAHAHEVRLAQAAAGSRPGLSSTLIESSELARLKARSHSASGKSWVTMPREVSSPRMIRSITTG